jgi:hypothetical protein
MHQDKEEVGKSAIKSQQGAKKRNYLIQKLIITKFLQKNESLTRARAI